MANLYTAVICGLGNIAWEFGNDPAGFPLSHATALAAHPQVRLAGGCDPDPEKRRGFLAAHGGQGFAGLEEMLDALAPDIVSLCSPAAQHFGQVLTCLERRVPMLWLEKPAAENAAQLRQLVARRKELGSRTTVLVNFQRRYTPCYQRLAEAMRSQPLGRPRRISLSYSRGLLANGIHMLDLLFFLTGTGTDFTLEWASPPVATDAASTNPSCVLTCADGLMVDIRGDNVPYHNIDVGITCEGGRLSVLHGGMTTAVETRVEHELYPGFFRLAAQDTGLLGPGGQRGAFSLALEDLLQAHAHAAEPASSLGTALRSQELLERILAGGAQ